MKYKPRMIEFDFFQIDTRRGMHGFYPGDIVRGENSRRVGIVLGVCCHYLAYAWSDDDNDICLDISGVRRYWTVIDRCGQALIDNGKMVMS